MPKPDDFEAKKFAYEMYRKEIEYRRDKAWKIFSWTATIFLGVIGGLTALFADKHYQIPWLHYWNQILLTGALAVLSAYSFLWISRNLDFEENVFRKMVELDLVDKVNPGNSFLARKYVGYNLTLVLLALVAILIIWIVPRSN